MEELVEQGLIKSIGVSNFSPQKLESFISDVKIRPAVNQVCLQTPFSARKLIQHTVTVHSVGGFADMAYSLATQALIHMWKHSATFLSVQFSHVLLLCTHTELSHA